MNGKVIFYCLPMSGRTHDEIINQIDHDSKIMTDYFNEKYPDDTLTIFCNYNTDTNNDYQKCKHPSIALLGRGLIKYMSECDIIVFGDGFDESMGCLCELTIANIYDIPIMYVNNIMTQQEV